MRRGYLLLLTESLNANDENDDKTLLDTTDNLEEVLIDKKDKGMPLHDPYPEVPTPPNELNFKNN